MGSKRKDEDLVTVGPLKSIMSEMIRSILNETLDEKMRIMERMKKDVEDLKKKVRDLEGRIEDRDKYDRRHNLVLYGLPMQPNERPLQFALDIIKAVNIDATPYDLDAAHRLKTRNDTQSPPFIIRFINRWRRDDVMEAFKDKKPRVSLWGGNQKVRVFCNEQLTPSAQALMAAARCHKELFYIWTSKGNIYYRKKLKDSEVRQVLDMADAETMSHLVTEEERKIIRAANERWKKQGAKPKHAESAECRGDGRAAGSNQDQENDHRES